MMVNVAPFSVAVIISRLDEISFYESSTIESDGLANAFKKLNKKIVVKKKQTVFP